MGKKLAGSELIPTMTFPIQLTGDERVGGLRRGKVSPSPGWVGGTPQICMAGGGRGRHRSDSAGEEGTQAAGALLWDRSSAGPGVRAVGLKLPGEGREVRPLGEPVWGWSQTTNVQKGANLHFWTTMPSDVACGVGRGRDGTGIGVACEGIHLG